MSQFISIDYSQFFDRQSVIDATDKATRSVLVKAGAFVRRRARSSIRRPGKSQATRVSQPGRPPKDQTGTLKRSILFGYERATESVVIGPSAQYGARDNVVPSLLEVGGLNRKGQRYKPRPFMVPALEAEALNFPELFRGKVTG